MSGPDPLASHHQLETFDCGKPSLNAWLLTHPIDEGATRFYTRFGFVASPLREQQLLLLLKDARKSIP